MDVIRDGVATVDELLSMETAGIRAISVEHTMTQRRDRWGNVFRYRALVTLTSGARRPAWDVYLRSAGVQEDSPVGIRPARPIAIALVLVMAPLGFVGILIRRRITR